MKKIIVAVVLFSMVFFSCKTIPNASGEMGSEKFKTKLTIPMLGNVFSVAISPDNKKIIADTTHGYKIFALKTGKELFNFEKKDGYNFFMYSPNGNQFLFLDSKADEIKFYDIKTEQEIHRLKAYGENYVYSPDGKRIAGISYGSKDRDYINVWDVNTGNELQTISYPVMDYEGLSFSSDGRHLFCLGKENIETDAKDVYGRKSWKYVSCFYSFNAETGLKENTFILSDGSKCVVVSPDGSQLIVILKKDDKYFPQLWNTKNGHLLTEHIGNLPLSVEPKVFLYNPKGTKIFLGLDDGTIRAYSSTTGRGIAISGYNASGSISALNFSKNGKYLVVGTANGNITLLGK